VQQQARTIVQKWQQQPGKAAAAALKEETAPLLCTAQARCELMSAGGMPCRGLQMLPELLEVGDWCIASPRARSAPKGLQRAEAGTAAPRHFNYSNNTPYLLENSSNLQQLLSGEAAAAGGSGLYTIRTAHAGLVSIAVARQSSVHAAAGDDLLWDIGAVPCCHKPKYKGKSFDLLKVALVFRVGKQAGAGSKRRAAE
jgi:hypothetical protein